MSTIGTVHKQHGLTENVKAIADVIAPRTANIYDEAETLMLADLIWNGVFKVAFAWGNELDITEAMLLGAMATIENQKYQATYSATAAKRFAAHKEKVVNRG